MTYEPMLLCSYTAEYEPMPLTTIIWLVMSLSYYGYVAGNEPMLRIQLCSR